MKRTLATTGVCAALTALSRLARADVTYTTQQRSITASTSSNANTQTLTAPGFGAFVENLNLETTIVTPGGALAPNTARVGIDCQLDPNAIRIVGSLAASGGISVMGGTPVLAEGEAQADIETLFVVTTPTPFRMTASPRPSTRPGDRYQIKLRNETTEVTLFELDENMPPQSVDFRGVLAPAVYELEFESELTFDGPEILRDFFFNLRLGECYANCDNSTATPELSVNDFVCFLNRFGAGDTYANCDQSTIAPVLNVNDFTCFLQKFAAGCN